MRTKQLCYAALLAGLGAIGFTTLARAEFGDNTPYYEDDAWYDVSEWFDGNDYNPTDETWWRWDDETYQASKDTGTDIDNDSWYGYTTRDDDDWYYDYYDPYPYTYYDSRNAGAYDYGSRYYDYDNDGVYDALATYYDTDGDGLYDDYNYYAFTDRGTDKQKKAGKEGQAREARQQTLTGTIEKTKMVKVRGGKQHIVVSIRPKEATKDQVLIADLGRADDLKGVNPKLGSQITVKGPKARVGQQAVILARQFELDGKTTQVNRTGRQFTGTVLSTHKSKKVRGQEHLMAMVETKQKDKTHKVAVDLGPTERLKMEVNKGQELTFTGFPVKVKNKPLIMADTIQKGDQTVQIQRQPNRMPGKNK